MYRLAGIFLKMRPRNADALLLAFGIGNKQLAVLDNGQLVLADLVTLGQIGVKIVLARKN